MVFGKTPQKTLLCLFFVYGGGMCVSGNGFVFVGFVFWPFLLGWIKMVHWIEKCSTLFT